jgi:hypothetical protein
MQSYNRASIVGRRPFEGNQNYDSSSMSKSPVKQMLNNFGKVCT